MSLPSFIVGLAVAATIGTGAPAPARAETPAETPASATCGPSRPELAHGFSLTGWFDETPSRPPDFAVLAQLRARGMTHVRLPVLAESVMTRFTTAANAQRKLHAVETGIDQLTAAGYAVVVDMHGGAKLEALFASDPQAARDAVIQAWTLLGPMMTKRVAAKVHAELLNEPPVDDAVWATLQPQIAAAARKVMPRTTFILSTGGPQRVEHLTATVPSNDRNTVWAVHYYDPMVFTHQGATWMRPDPIGWLHDVPFPIRAGDPRLVSLVNSLRAAGQNSVADYLASLLGLSFTGVDIRRDMASLAAWSKKYGRPVVLGEFGVYRGKVAPADRRTWLMLVTGAASASCLGWTHWEYRDGFGFVDGRSGKLDDYILSGLVGIKGPR